MKGKKKIILFGAILAASLMLMMPAVNVVKAQNFLTTKKKNIQINQPKKENTDTNRDVYLEKVKEKISLLKKDSPLNNSFWDLIAKLIAKFLVWSASAIAWWTSPIWFPILVIYWMVTGQLEPENGSFQNMFGGLTTAL